MRKYAFSKKNTNVDVGDGFAVKKYMIHDTGGEGVFLFLYNSTEDKPCCADLWYETVEEAKEACRKDHGIEKRDWVEIPDPLPFCQQDTVATHTCGRPGGRQTPLE